MIWEIQPMFGDQVTIVAVAPNKKPERIISNIPVSVARVLCKAHNRDVTGSE